MISKKNLYKSEIKIYRLNKLRKKLKKIHNNQCIHIIGNRNSFSKTDHDATFMRMKEDAMRDGQLKPAYNIQFGMDTEYVVCVKAEPQCTDTTMLIPFLDTLREKQKRIYKRVIADSGYESGEIICSLLFVVFLLILLRQQKILLNY